MESEKTISQIKAYIIDFYRHLNSVQECKERFMTFYPHWEKLRLTTIKSLEDLLEELKFGENVVDGEAATGNAGFMGIFAHLFSTVISPLWAVITKKASAVSIAKEKVKKLMEQDLEESRVFLKLGLADDRVIKKMKHTVENIHRMSWSYSEEQLEKEINTAVSVVAESRNDHLLAHGKAALPENRAAKFVGQIDIKNVAGIVEKSLEHNPELKSAVRSLFQVVSNATDLIRLTDNEAISSRIVFCLTGMLSLRQNCMDVAKCITHLVIGAWTAEDNIRSTLGTLKMQHEWLRYIHTRLSQDDLSSFTSRDDFAA